MGFLFIQFGVLLAQFGIKCGPWDHKAGICVAQMEVIRRPQGGPNSFLSLPRGRVWRGPNPHFAGLGASVKTSVSRKAELNPEGPGPPRSKPGGYNVTILDVVLEGDG